MAPVIRVRRGHFVTTVELRLERTIRARNQDAQMTEVERELFCDTSSPIAAVTSQVHECVSSGEVRPSTDEWMVLLDNDGSGAQAVRRLNCHQHSVISLDDSLLWSARGRQVSQNEPTAGWRL